jgi:hypothetical protein
MKVRGRKAAWKSALVALVSVLIFTVMAPLTAKAAAGNAPPTATFNSVGMPPGMKWTRKTTTQFIDRMVKFVVQGGNGDALSHNDQDALILLPNAMADWATKYPKDKDVPYYLYLAGYVETNLRGNDEGADLYNFLIANYPKSEWAAKAKVDLKEMGR